MISGDSRTSRQALFGNLKHRRRRTGPTALPIPPALPANGSAFAREPDGGGRAGWAGTGVLLDTNGEIGRVSIR